MTTNTGAAAPSDPALIEALSEKIEAIAAGATQLDALATVVAPKIAKEIVEQLAADITTRLRIDALAGDDLILSRDEAAKFLGRKAKTLEAWAARGEGPRVVTIGPRSVGYRVGDLRAHAKGDPCLAREAVTKQLMTVEN